MSHFYYYATGPSEHVYSSEDYWTFNKCSAQSTQNCRTLPQFSPTSSALFNALGSCVPAPTTTVLTGTASVSYHIPSVPVDHGLDPAGPSVQNSGWPLPDLTRSHDDSPISSSSTGPPTPPSMPASRGPVAQEFWQEPTLPLVDYQPEDPPPSKGREGQFHKTQRNACRHSAINQDFLLNDEGIVPKHIISGPPTGAGQPHTSENHEGQYTPHAPQAQRESGGNDGASRGAEKRERRAEDSPEADGDNVPSHKRVRHAFSGGEPAMDYQQIPVRRQRPVRTREGVPVITFTPPRTCNPVPSPQSQKPLPPQGQNGHCGGEQESWTDFQFVAHVGSLNREGVASTRKATTEKKRYTVNRFQLSVASTAPEMASMLESLEMGVERQQTTRRSRATVEDAPIERSKASRSKKLPNARGAVAEDEQEAALYNGSSAGMAHVESDGIHRWR